MTRFKTLVLMALLFFVAVKAFPQVKKDTLITQTITYHTKKAGEMYLVWNVNGWNIPDKKYWNENSYLERNMVWSKMNRSKNSFSISITLLAKTVLNFMFWVPIDQSGDSTDGWDTYGEQTYSSTYAERKTLYIDDSALWMPEKKEFKFIEHGLLFFGDHW